MTDRQTAARKIMERFVTDHGGDCSDITNTETAYRWKAPDGRVASVGWKVG